MRQPPQRRSLDDLYRSSMGLADEQPPMPAVSQDTTRTRKPSARDLDALYAETSGAPVAAAPAATADRRGPSRPYPETTLGEDITGLVRQIASGVTFGQYPRMVGALGGDEAALREYMEEYKGRKPAASLGARILGEAAPYYVAAPARAIGAVGQRLGLGRALQSAERAYTRVRNAPLAGTIASKVLPTSGATATNIALIEGARGALEAAPDESALAEGAERVATALPFGRLGEVVGTYAAGRVGPTLGKQATKIQQRLTDIGDKLNAWKGGEPVPLTPALAKLYKTKVVKEAVDEAAAMFNRKGNDPLVLATAYHNVVQKYRGTPQMADIQRNILQPFLAELDNAAQGKISPLIRQYADAKKAEEAIGLGTEAVRYLRTGTGDPTRVSPEVLLERARSGYASPEEAQALAQSLITSLGRGRGTFPTGPAGIVSQIVTPLRGAGPVSNIVSQLGGTPSFAQRMAQQAGTTLGATQAPGRR